MGFQLRIAAFALLLGCTAADRAAEDCEACGLVVWRMQTLVAKKSGELESLKKAKEKRAKQSTKAHNKRWLRQEYAVELANALEEQLAELPKDKRIIAGTCNVAANEAVEGSELRTGGSRHATNYVDPQRCAERVEARLSELLGDSQDELVDWVLAGHGAGSACEATVPDCEAERATLLLGPSYEDELSEWTALDRVSVGFAPDKWTHHIDVDGSSYWFNKAKKFSVREAPDGWRQTADGSWAFKPEAGAPAAASHTEEAAAAAAASGFAADAAPAAAAEATAEAPPAETTAATKAEKVAAKDGEDDEHWVDRAMKDWDPRKVRDNVNKMRHEQMAKAALRDLEKHAPRPKDEI